MVRSLSVLLLGFVGLPILRAEDAPKNRSTAEKSSTLSRIQRKSYRFEEAGKDMEYAQFVPSSYDRSKKAPLVIALHGLGSNPQQIIRYPGLTDLAEKHGYIVVAPMGYNSRGWYGQRIRIGVLPNDPENLHELSEKDVMNVLDLARKEFEIDPHRIYLMGHSMGGGGTFHLAMQNPNLFAALGPIAPAICRPVTDLEKSSHLGRKDARTQHDLRIRRSARWRSHFTGHQRATENLRVFQQA